MKTFAAGFIFALTISMVSAQQITEQTLPWKNSQSVKLDLKYAEHITIEAWNKNEVFFKAQYSINDGQLDSAHFISKTSDNNSIFIEAGLQESVIKESNWYNCGNGKTISFNSGKKDHCKCICTDIHYTLYLPAGANLELETITGDVKITGMKGIIEAKSVSGTVEVVIAGNQKADVQLKTVMGRIASDPDLATLSEDGLRPLLARKINGKINGGGNKISLESVTGNVLLKSGG